MSGSDYIEFEKAIFIDQRLLKSTNQSKRIKGLYVIVAVNLGLRIGDLLKLQWNNLTGEQIIIVEEKTRKKVDRKLNHYIQDAVKLYGPGESSALVFVSQKGSVFSRQAINSFLQDQWGISSHEVCI